jgi:hypothetical protein
MALGIGLGSDNRALSELTVAWTAQAGKPRHAGVASHSLNIPGQGEIRSRNAPDPEMKPPPEHPQQGRCLQRLLTLHGEWHAR